MSHQKQPKQSLLTFTCLVQTFHFSLEKTGDGKPLKKLGFLLLLVLCLQQYFRLCVPQLLKE